MNTSLQMSALAFDVAWAAAGLGEKPTALNVPSPGATFEQRRHLEEQAWVELHRNGLAHQGRLRDDTYDVLLALSRPPRELYGYFGPVADKPDSLMVVRGGASTVFARVGRDVVVLERVESAMLATVMAERLPATGKGRGPSRSAPVNEVLGQVRPDQGILQRSSGGPSAAAENIRRVLEQVRVNAGQFYSATRDQLGKRTRSADFIAVIDTVDGRYLIEKRANDSPEPWLVLSPADTGTVARGFDTLLSG